MKLERVPYDPGAVMAFFEEGLGSLGALYERTWHDRLEIVAEGPAARFWNANGSMYSGELHFAPADTTGVRDASLEVFPGCPLTFRLAEALRPESLTLERIVLAQNSHLQPPAPEVAEKLWRAQFPDTARWRLAGSFKSGIHFSLVALVRCETQAIDQHWSLRRIAVSLPGGAADDNLAQEITFAQAETNPAREIDWPAPDSARWTGFIQLALERDMEEEVSGIRARQEKSLRRELDRIDAYFENYSNELAARANRSSNENSKIKGAERLAAAKAEHARRRADQVARHEIRIRPQVDALLLVAESAWTAHLEVDRDHKHQTIDGVFVPRSRRWIV